MELTEDLKKETVKKMEVEKNGETATYRMKRSTTISEIFFSENHSLTICNIKWLLFLAVFKLFNISKNILIQYLKTVHTVTCLEKTSAIRG